MKSIASRHGTQTHILETLRWATRARYSELRRPTGIESDIFKYHIKKLMRQHYIMKADDGLYELTAEGKELANRLDSQTGRELMQPKASMLLVVYRMKHGERYYLGHKRTREPFRDFWGIASAPMLRGILIVESAARELEKQTGISAHFRVAGLQRVIDVHHKNTVLEDKLFTVLVAEVDGSLPLRPWYGGESCWLRRKDLLMQPKLFPTTAKTLDMVEGNELFVETICHYTDEEY